MCRLCCFSWLFNQIVGQERLSFLKTVLELTGNKNESGLQTCSAGRLTLQMGILKLVTGSQPTNVLSFPPCDCSLAFKVSILSSGHTLPVAPTSHSPAARDTNDLIWWSNYGKCLRWRQSLTLSTDVYRHAPTRLFCYHHNMIWIPFLPF